MCNWIQSYIYFRALLLEIQRPQNFGDIQTERPTNRHFLKMVKSCSGHLKTCKSIENWMSKIFASLILSSYAHRRSKKSFLRTVTWEGHASRLVLEGTKGAGKSSSLICATVQFCGQVVGLPKWRSHPFSEGSKLWWHSSESPWSDSISDWKINNWFYVNFHFF